MIGVSIVGDKAVIARFKAMRPELRRNLAQLGCEWRREVQYGKRGGRLADESGLRADLRRIRQAFGRPIAPATPNPQARRLRIAERVRIAVEQALHR